MADLIDPAGDSAERSPLLAERIVKEVRRRTIANRKDLCDTLGVSESTLSRHVTPLIERDFLCVAVPNLKEKPVALAPAVGTLVGVDLTLSRARVVVADATYRLLNRSDSQVTVPDMRDPQQTLSMIADLVAGQLEFSEVASDDVIGVGLGLPGPIERDTGIPDSDSILPGWRGVPVAARLAELLDERGLPGMRVIVGNDASVGALGVYTRAVIADPEGTPLDIVYLRITHGIGAGLVLKGHLVMGGHGFAGEIGHLRVGTAGPLCQRCGARGCLETLASETSVRDSIAEAAELGRNATLTDALATDHPARQHALWEAGWHIGLALAVACNLVNPTWAVLGGDMADIPTFRGAVHHSLERNALPQAFASVDVRTWRTLLDPPKHRGRQRQMPPPGRDIGSGLTPEQLGALALVLDEFGDRFVLRKVRDAWYAGDLKPARDGKTGKSRRRELAD